MEVVQLKALVDNYVHIIVCKKTGEALIVDPSEASLVLSYIRESGLKPTGILNTHHHWDHVGGNEDVFSEYPVAISCSSYDKNRIKRASHALKDGDVVRVGELKFSVLEIPGHTLGHIALFGEGALFCGDTLFVGGCGRLFEGTAAQMFASLSRLKALPDATRVYCAHEYTQSNLAFALTIEPDHKELHQKIDEVTRLRKQNLSTVPSTIADEKLYNVFLRWESSEVVKALEKKGERDLTRPEKIFAALRRLKDQF